MEKDILREIKRHGKLVKGQKELIKYLKGEKLTKVQALKAKCYDCMGYFADGRADCMVYDCALYPFMPFSTKKPEKSAKRVESGHRIKNLGNRA